MGSNVLVLNGMFVLHFVRMLVVGVAQGWHSPFFSVPGVSLADGGEDRSVLWFKVVEN